MFLEELKLDKYTDLQILEEELLGINETFNKAQERLNIVNKTESVLSSIQKLLVTTKTISLDSYDTQYNKITENILKIKELAENIPYNCLTDFNKDEIIPQGAICYNFSNINYNSLIMTLPKTPPISKKDLESFIKEIESKNNSLNLQLSQLMSYKKKLELTINNLSVTAIASYLCS